MEVRHVTVLTKYIQQMLNWSECLLKKYLSWNKSLNAINLV